MSSGPAPLCRVCHERTAEYTCPRCNARYCSLGCYKQHSERCTEGFYRDAAVAELKSITAGQDEKQRMLDILQRLHQQELEDEGEGSEAGSDGEGDDAEEGGLSAQTLHRLLAKMEACGGELDVGAEDLSPAELAGFHRALAAGELSGAVQPWQPWWLTEEAAQLELGAGGTPLVVAHAAAAAAAAAAPGPAEAAGGASGEAADAAGQQQQAAGAADAGSGSGGGGMSALPAPPSRPLPPLAALTRAAPSPLLQYQLLDLLYAYCLTLRQYNGDYRWAAAEAADTLFALSAVLAAVLPGAAGAAGGGPSGDSTTAAAAAAAAAGGVGGGAGTDADTAAAPVLGCLQRACQPPVGGPGSRGLAVSVLSDVAAVLQLGRSVVLTALMDTSRIVEAARQQLEAGSAGGDAGGSSRGSGVGRQTHRQTQAQKQQQKELRRRLVAAERKLLFFLAWANELAPHVYAMLAVAVERQRSLHAAALDQRGGVQQQRQQEGGAAGLGSTPGLAASAMLPQLQLQGQGAAETVAATPGAAGVPRPGQQRAALVEEL